MANTSDNSALPEECIADEDNTKHPIAGVPGPSVENVWFQENITDYEKLVIAFKTAESDIKAAEIVDKVRNGLLVPAVNELRYCSYHLIKAISADNTSDQKEQIHRATRHCERASFDALELGLSTLIIKIEEFKQSYLSKNVVIASVVGNYADDMAEVRHGQGLLTDNYKDKIKNFEAVRQQLSKIKKIYIKLEEAEPDIQTAAQQNNRTLKYTLIGLLVSLLIAGAGWYKVFSGEKQLDQMQKQLNQLQQILSKGNQPLAEKPEDQ